MKLQIMFIMEYLPDEIMILIFEYASAYDLATSFQYVCARWNYLINTSEKIWRGDITLKGLTEQECGNDLNEILRQAPKLKYLQIGYPHPNIIHEKLLQGELVLELIVPTYDLLVTIRDVNKDIEYLQIVDRFFGTECLGSIINRPTFKKLSVIFDRLCGRQQKIRELKDIFNEIPELDSECVHFSQRIKFLCEKEEFSKWKITYDFNNDMTDEFS